MTGDKAPFSRVGWFGAKGRTHQRRPPARCPSKTPVCKMPAGKMPPARRPSKTLPARRPSKAPARGVSTFLGDGLTRYVETPLAGVLLIIVCKMPAGKAPVKDAAGKMPVKDARQRRPPARRPSKTPVKGARRQDARRQDARQRRPPARCPPARRPSKTPIKDARKGRLYISG